MPNFFICYLVFYVIYRTRAIGGLDARIQTSTLPAQENEDKRSLENIIAHIFSLA